MPYLFECLERLGEAIHGRVLAQGHVKRAQVDHKNDGGYFVEALDPLSALISLTADVEHVELDVFDEKMGLEDASCEHTTPEYVLVGGRVVSASNYVETIEEVGVRVDEMVLVAVFGTSLKSRIVPQSF